MCPGATKSCTEAGSSHTSSTSHARKTLLIPSSGSNYQRSVHCVFCYYPDRLLEDRSQWFVLAFVGACALGSLYGFLQGAWPFGIVEAIWCVVAGRRWWLKGDR